MFSYLNLRFVLVIFAGSLFIYSCKDCSKKVPCPAYEDAILDAWFPYSDQQQLVFKSNSNSFDTFNLNLTELTDAYEYTTGVYGGGNGGCNATKSFSATKKDSLNYPAFRISLNKGTDLYSTAPVRNTGFSFYKKFFSGQNLGEGGFSNFSVLTEYNIIPQTFTNYSLNGILYPIVQSASTDTSLDNSAGVYKIIYAKNYGIIAYESNPGAVLWIKQ
ncbi:MAG: hypothetical protein H7X88_06915 [Gloeobacteraceae cyanobacterium ES-bin-316]|nr:hypothetical protein [Ferruginibacter sp.]